MQSAPAAAMFQPRPWLRGGVLGIATALGLVASVLLPFGVSSLLRQEQVAASQAAHSLEVMNAAAVLAANVADFASEGRGYLVDSNEDTLGRFALAERRVATDLAVLTRLTADEPTQGATMARLAPLVTARLGALRGVVEQKRAGDATGALAAVRTHRGRELMDQLLAALTALRTEETRLLDTRGEAARHAATLTLAGVIGCGTVIAGSVVLSTALLVGWERKRHHLTVLRQLNAGLEARVQARTAELAASEARQHAYVDHLADGFLAIRAEPDGHFVYEQLNEAARALLGLTETAVGRRIEEVWPDETAQSVIACLRRCVAARAPIRYARTHPTAQGVRDLRVAMAPVLDRSGRRVELLLTTMRDVSNEALLETQLQQAQRMEAVGRLSAGVAHDFNNLLQAQMGSLELLQDALHAGAIETASRHAATALRMGERSAHLTQHLLSFSRDQVLRPVPVAVDAFLWGLQEILARALGPALRLDIAASCGESVLVDPSLLETALLNLSFNARDAMPRGGRLRLSARTEPAGGTLEPGRYVVLAVTDEGTGMSPETRARATEAFFTTKGAHGSGLGLAMVHGFARQSGGAVTIDSAVGRGTTVELWLPVTARVVSAAPAPPRRPRRHAGRALVVDDVEEVLVAVATFLEGDGFAVQRAASGEAALALLTAGEAFDVMITDYAMPGITGAELVAAARERIPDLPAVVITGYAEQLTSHTLPGVAVVRKPFRREGLLQAVQDVTTPAEARSAA